ncbi:MAG TPA: PAS domain-containing protein, partial [Actinomycetota bacterium]
MTAETADQASPGEASFQLLAEHLPDLVIFAFDTDLRIWAATGGGIRARGWTTEEFIGMTVPEIAGATRADDIRACCLAALAGERTQLEMAGYEPPDRLWSLHFVPLGGPGTGDGMVLCRDVTEQRRAEELLRASQRQLAKAQRIAQVGSWEWDLETDKLTVSDELCRLFGLPIGVSMTMAEGVAATIHPADQERVATALGRIRDDPSPFALEHRIIRPDGDVRTVLARGEGVADENGRLVRFIGTDQDITDRRRADAERRRLLNRVYEAQEGQDR